ncbi:GTPase Era [Dethiosulfatarculus sandiegensis]|uniref:GTPase Era n=1 Tax=Dethiosulfatarculus sandiegensis TaxID=1429043 RepID=A0A0D2GIE0_9BACT|nr:GTPase Era [Dethiosulfatarculus sandiegensis]KIX14582.1 GTPase Era [Dethiosulfatarculus sandiegensis]
MKSGFIAIAGAPNVGKSTFLNQVLGFKLAITSDKPQTTRHRLLGVHNDRKEDLQIVFLDTPGLHDPDKPLNRVLVDTAMAALEDVDAVLFMADVTRKGLEASQKVAELLQKSKKPTLLAVNKIDLLPQKKALFPILDQANSWGEWSALVPISAMKGDGCELVVSELAGLLPEGDPLFPPDVITDLSMRFLAAEMIREKVFRLTEREVPYSVAVTVDEFLEPEEEDGTTAISATIHVERSGQKAIIIGKRGSMIKKIGTKAREDLETMIGTKVFLDLFVRVEPKWSTNAGGLRKMGFDS